MRALVVKEGQVTLVGDYPDPKPAKDELLIRVSLAGICATDLEIVKGYMAYQGVLGHECVGVVERGPAELKGKRVVVEINRVCGKCDLCQSGLSSHCRHRSTLGIHGWDGCFAEYITAPRRNVHPVPDHLSDEQAVLVEPLAAACQIVQQVRVEPRDRIMVMGDGRLGLLTAQVLHRLAGPNNLTLLGKHEEKLAFAEKRGIRTARLGELIVRPQWDLVVDCTGCADGFALACRLVRPRGTLVLKSTFHADSPVDLAPLVINEIQLVGSRCGPFPTALNMLATDQIETNGLVTARFSLDEAVAALARAADPGQIKVVIDMTR